MTDPKSLPPRAGDAPVEPPQFRKKPVVIQAEQFFRDKPLPFSKRGDPVCFGCDCGDRGVCTFCTSFWVQTLEGKLTVSDGDWIIRGVKGEFYPCKPDVFALTYEPLPAASVERGTVPQEKDRTDGRTKEEGSREAESATPISNLRAVEILTNMPFTCPLCLKAIQPMVRHQCSRPA